MIHSTTTVAPSHGNLRIPQNVHNRERLAREHPAEFVAWAHQDANQLQEAGRSAAARSLLSEAQMVESFANQNGAE